MTSLNSSELLHDASSRPGDHPAIERDGDCLVLRGEAVVVVRNGFLAEMNAVQALREEATTLLGREVPLLSHLRADVQRLYELLDGSQAAGVARVPTTDETPTLLRAALHRIQEDLAMCVAANGLRLRLGAPPEEMIPRTRQLETVAAELRGHVGEASRPRTLRQWIEADSSPRLELLRKACKMFLDSGMWLKLGGELKAWKKLDPDADVNHEAEAMWRYCRIDGDRLIPRIEAFALFPESAPYLDRVLSLVRLGIERFLQGANLEPDQRPAVTAKDLAAIAGDMPLEQLVRFVDHVSCLSGRYCWTPFSWTPDRHLLRYYPATNADDLVAAEGLSAREHGMAEERLWLLRVVADTWLETRAWPTLDGLVADSRVGPQFAPALKSLAYTWIKSPDHRLATLDLDGLILGASTGESLVQTVATIVGTLADELEAEQSVSVADIARLTDVDAELVRHLLPVLDRSDLGLFVRGVSTDQIEAEARPHLAEYLGVRSGDALAARWVRNRERHPESARAGDGGLLNVFGVKTLKDRLRALGARGRDLDLSVVESCAHTDRAGSAVPGRDRQLPRVSVETAVHPLATSKPVRILHISDLHERAAPPQREPRVRWDARQRGQVLGSRFYDAIQEFATGGIDIVCFTGDLADWGDPAEYEKATARIDAILQAAGGVPRSRFFAIPGNHDVQRKVQEDAWRGLRTWVARSNDRSPLGRWLHHVEGPPIGLQDHWRDLILQRTAAFWSWLDSFRGAPLRVGGYIPLGYRATISAGDIAHVPEPIHIIGLDSAWMCGADETADEVVLTDRGSILLTDEQVEAHVRDGENALAGLRICLLHHPLDYLGDQRSIRRLLGGGAVDLLLHGHQHEPGITFADEPGAALRTVAAGCLIEGDLGKGWPNGFHVIELDTASRAGAVHLRKWSKDGLFWTKATDIYRNAPDGVLRWTSADHFDAG